MQLRRRRPRRLAPLLGALLCLGVASCGFNEVVDVDEAVKASWSEVENQYQRRADLVPNLVNTVKGAARFEQDTLRQVVEARSRVAGVKVDSDTIDDPEKLRKFEAAQGQLSGALSRLMVVMEKYPDLKATQAFRELQAQLEGTENRATVARRRFIEAVQQYNTTVQHFPTMIGAFLRGKHVRPTFAGSPAAATPPTVQF